jgi:hypothetical protein
MMRLAGLWGLQGDRKGRRGWMQGRPQESPLQ